MGQEFSHGLASARLFIRLQSRCHLGLWSHLKAQIGKDTLPTLFIWLLSRYTLRVVALKALIPHCQLAGEHSQIPATWTSPTW